MERVAPCAQRERVERPRRIHPLATSPSCAVEALHLFSPAALFFRSGLLGHGQAVERLVTPQPVPSLAHIQIRTVAAAEYHSVAFGSVVGV